MRPMKPNESCDQKAAIRQVPEPSRAPSVKASAAIKMPCRTPNIGGGHSISLGRQARDASVKKNNDGSHKLVLY